MNREQAIKEIWSNAYAVASQFACSQQDHWDISNNTEEALRALGVDDEEMREYGNDD